MTHIPPTTVLVTERTRLRIPSEADLPQVWAATRFPGFNDGLLWDAPETQEDLELPHRRGLERWAAGEAYGWTIEQRHSAAFPGRVAVSLTGTTQVWSLGFWIHPAHQGRGFAREAAQALVDFAFDHLDARKIVAGHATWNAASARVLEAVGMQRVGTDPHGFRKQGQWVEEHEYELVNPMQLSTHTTTE